MIAAVLFELLNSSFRIGLSRDQAGLPTQGAKVEPCVHGMCARKSWRRGQGGSSYRIVSIVRKIVRIFKSPFVKKLVENVRRWFNSIDASFPPLKTVTLIKVCCAEWNLRLGEFFRVSNNLRRFLLFLEYRINCSTNNKNYRNISDSYICEVSYSILWIDLKISSTCYFF